EVASRIFQGVQQPVCIVMASRGAEGNPDTPARARFRALPVGRREVKFDALAKATLGDDDWVNCPDLWEGPFLPARKGDWAAFPSLESLFRYNGAGVQTKRTWVIAPDTESLSR